MLCGGMGTNTSVLSANIKADVIIDTIQLASNETQMVTDKTINTPIRAALSTINDKHGAAVNWDKKTPDVITINESGTYLIMASVQAGAKEGTPFNGADIRFWCTLNGKAIIDSGSWIYASKEARSNTIINQMVMDFKKGDKAGFMYSSSAANSGLLALHANTAKRLPNAPSITITMIRIPRNLNNHQIQLVSNNTQVATNKTINTPIKATLSTQNNRYGTAISWDKKTPNAITINEDGRYFIITSAQAGAKEGVPFNGADIRFWYTLNDKEIPDSGNWVYAAKNARSKTIVSQLRMSFKKGDKIGLMYSSSSANGGLLTLPANTAKNLPNAPSLMISMMKSVVDNHIQLASNDMQIVTTNEAIDTPIKTSLSIQDDKSGKVINWSKKTPNIISINEDGYYFITTAAQVGAKENIPFNGADIRLWYTVNDKEIPDSGNWIYASKADRSNTIVSQVIMKFKKDDKIGLMYSSSAVNGGLLSFPADTARHLPNAPCLTVTMVKFQ